MTTKRRKSLSSLMSMAWSFFRTEPSRGFPACLKSAWAWTRRMAKSSAKFMRGVRPGVRVDFSRSLIRSPASNHHGHGTMADRHAGQSISRVGR